MPKPNLLRVLVIAFGLPVAMGSQCTDPLGEIFGDLSAFYAGGGLTIELCTEPDLQGCERISANIAGEPVKLDTSDLPIADNALRSLSVICGRPTTVIAYDHCTFRGEMAVFRCEPGEALEVRAMGNMASRTSSIVFTDDQRTGEDHAAVDLSLAVPLLHSGISDALAGVSVATGTTDPDFCDLYPSCCGGGGVSGSDALDGASPRATEVFWTEPVNIATEIAHELSPTQSCRDRGGAEQLLAVHHYTTLDIDQWAFDYDVDMYWYFEPVLRSLPSAPSGQLYLNLHRTELFVEGGVLQGSIESGIGAEMGAAGSAIACAMLSEIKAQADAVQPLFGGIFVLTNNDRIGWSFADPVPCAAERRLGIGCGDYKAAPPTLILHKD